MLQMPTKHPQKATVVFNAPSIASFSAPLGCPLATDARQPSLLPTEIGAYYPQMPKATELYSTSMMMYL